MFGIAKIAGLLMIIVGLTAGLSDSRAQSVAEMEQAEALTRAAVGHVNGLIHKNGNAALRNLIRNVKFEVDRTPMPNAFVFHASGNYPKVVISTQMTLLFYYFAELAVLNSTEIPSLMNCTIEYSNYVQDQYGKLRAALFLGGRADAIRSPERYAIGTGGGCSRLLDLYPFPAHLRPMRDWDVTGAVAFVYLHEIGHLARNHVREHEPDLDRMPDELTRRRTFLSYMCRSREAELEADAFAADTLVDLGVATAAMSMSLWLAMVATTGLDPALEQIATHPTGITRQTSVLRRMRSRLEAKGESIDSQMQELIDDYIAFNRRVQQQLPPPPMPDGTRYVCS